MEGFYREIDAGTHFEFLWCLSLRLLLEITTTSMASRRTAAAAGDHLQRSTASCGASRIGVVAPCPVPRGCLRRRRRRRSPSVACRPRRWRCSELGSRAGPWRRRRNKLGSRAGPRRRRCRELGSRAGPLRRRRNELALRRQRAGPLRRRRPLAGIASKLGLERAGLAGIADGGLAAIADGWPCWDRGRRRASWPCSDRGRWALLGSRQRSLSHRWLLK